MLSLRATEAAVTLHLPLSAVRELGAASIEGAQAFADLAGIKVQLSVRVVSDLLIPQAARRNEATLLRITRADASRLLERGGGALHAPHGDRAPLARRRRQRTLI